MIKNFSLLLLSTLGLIACDDSRLDSPADASTTDHETQGADDTMFADSNEDSADTSVSDTTLDTVEPGFEGIAGLAATEDGRAWPFLAPTSQPVELGEPIATTTRALHLWSAGEDVLGTESRREHVVRFGAAPGFPVEATWDLGADSWPTTATLLPDGDTVVALGGRPELVVLDPEGARRTLSLPAFDDPDGNPDAHALLVDGPRLLIALSRLDAQADANGLDIGEPAVLAEIDPLSGTVLDTLALPLTNARPGLVRVDEDTFAVGLAGQDREDAGGGLFQLAVDGAIVLVERGTDGRLAVGQTIVTESDLGGALSHFVMLDAHRGVAMTSNVTGFNGATWFEYDPLTGETTTQRIDEPSGDTAGGSACLSPDHAVLGIVGTKDFLGRGVEGIFLFDTTSRAPLVGSPVELGAIASNCVLTHPR